MYDTTHILEHHGVKGQKWGVRKSIHNASTNHKAKKDAKRYADAKMYYGKGAGTRRKLLKAEIDKKRSTIEGYGDKFDSHVKNVDYAKSARKAKRERRTRDTVHRVNVDGKAILGVTSGTLISVGAAYYAHNPEKVNGMISKVADVTINTYNQKKVSRNVNTILKNSGMYKR